MERKKNEVTFPLFCKNDQPPEEPEPDDAG